MLRTARPVLIATTVLVALLALLAVSAPAEASAPPPAASVLIPCSAAGSRVQVTVSSHLDPGCTYTAGLDVVASGVVLDCQGALVSNPTGGGVGIGIVTPSDVSMSDVVVRNCRTEGFTNGIKPTRTGFRSLAAGHEFDHTLSGITIEDSQVTASRGVGIFVDGYVSGVTIRRVTVRGAGSTGIYLEAGSKENLVEDNQLLDNGFSENGRPEGQLTTFNGFTVRFWGPGREGLAIDGSWRNVVRDNLFSGNQAGGIFLYTNCGEYVRSRPDRWYQRRYGADDNLIEQNRFVGGENGVWIGSRMGENTYPMECSDRPYVSGPLESIVLDRAARTTVRDNTFDDVRYGIRVEDDGSTITGNRFSGSDAGRHAVIVGTRVRTTALDHPVRGTTIVDNESTIAGNPYPYRWTYGQQDTVMAGNRALGRAAPLCRGVPLPHNVMIFVHYAVAEDPNGPPTPRPDFEVPVLGPLPPCPVPTLTPDTTARAVEGDRVLTVPVTLSEPSTEVVTATWHTVDPSKVPAPAATAGADFAAASGTVTFLPGTTTATVSIAVTDDDVAEDDELVVVALEGAVDARVGGFLGLGVGAIEDDDQPTVVPGVVEVAEGDVGWTVAEVPLRLDRPSATAVTVGWATLDPGRLPAGAADRDDFVADAGTVTFAPGQTEAVIPVRIVGDEDPEADAFVLVALDPPVGARRGGFLGLGGVVVLDDDTPSAGGPG